MTFAVNYTYIHIDAVRVLKRNGFLSSVISEMKNKQTINTLEVLFQQQQFQTSATNGLPINGSEPGRARGIGDKCGCIGTPDHQGAPKLT